MQILLPLVLQIIKALMFSPLRFREMSLLELHRRSLVSMSGLRQMGIILSELQRVRRWNVH